MAERIAVVGAGVMGGNHVRTLAQHGAEFGAKITHIIDANKDRAQQLAVQYGIEVADFDDLDSDLVDGVVVVSPSQFHADHSLQLMKNGVNVLVEKPAANSRQELDDMEKIAVQEHRTLMVGHVELFNPVVQRLIEELGDRAVRSIRTKRLGNVADESRLYHDVIRDLLVHDLSIVDKIITPSETPKVVAAFGRKDTKASPDPAEAIVTYDGSVDAHMRASRAYQGQKTRMVEIETEDGVIVGDLLQKTIAIRHDKAGKYVEGAYIPEVLVNETQFATGPQPLENELRFFVKCMKGEADPAEMRVSIQDARRVLLVAEDIVSRTVILT